ncbi:MAG: hypothetical protein A3H59_04065 [Candidatus Jacksonbacteria bacterium RIFCSPLOWO2_02_FULL_43_9]|nr:MAG: Acetate kinase [Parcubacteria group bacterium GW2011_GWA2_43_13]OGY69739.1 MAG: hypothetical protein A3B94_00425 [Candidatus Jacksonbacteria bacterium RIFCSPHIGHO2_02_FULL_43_10]OGY71470.1 MAG: hypothetical protein A2986_03960 [Candidatus Jacksonbacteria bacterium RIFCSPLOWO2_01_FULL_44_13]OGY74403.1 MAG: hypothetical protein A3H59_04065 [Candidatus Jacksonbacteria bacterium RIFCSPLOWO2_02_FULL_43_9]HAZ16546.1 acetate kinase [Candidatus Jacksonbacteria bacterium]
MILVLNVGSTSIKFGLYDRNEREVNRGVLSWNGSVATGVKHVLREIGNPDIIEAVGHRVVHGGNEYSAPVVIDADVIKNITTCNALAPLHNPYNIEGINAARLWLSAIPHIAVFDTAFFSVLPKRAQMYAIPFDYFEDGIRRYGFHGISHEYLIQETARLLQKKENDINLITCHLGGGASITAIKKGKPIDTSMGFTPMEGLMMMSRCGDIDPGLLVYLQKKGVDIEHFISHESGFAGMLKTQDFLEVIEKVKKNHPKARLAFDLFLYKLAKYIGAYSAILETVDALVISGGIGTGDPFTLASLEKSYPWIKKFHILTIETNEEKAIARKAIPFL